VDCRIPTGIVLTLGSTIGILILIADEAYKKCHLYWVPRTNPCPYLYIVLPLLFIIGVLILFGAYMGRQPRRKKRVDQI